MTVRSVNKLRVGGYYLLLLTWCVLPLLKASEPGDTFLTPNWVVKVHGGHERAREVAADAKMKFLREVRGLDDHYVLRADKETLDYQNRGGELTETLRTDDRVAWVKQQEGRHYHLRSRRAIDDEIRRLREMNSDHERPEERSPHFTDPLFEGQWYLYNHGQHGAKPGLDINVVPAWKLGYTGKGVVVTIVDDGLAGDHPDLKDNFNINASIDLNNETYDRNPAPDGEENGHGTECGGEVAAKANNGVCGVGVAHNSQIGGIRILAGPTTDLMESEALLFNNNFIDIYSCSWGPRDTGDYFHKSAELISQALEKGVKEGRNGKGSIFVWASGNGGAYGDHCGADGYINRPESIAIGALGDTGYQPIFGEQCSGTIASVPCGGKSYGHPGGYHNLITTTEMHGHCTTGFAGTSSAAPLAAGILALVLEANPTLSWRDVQHLIAVTSSIPSSDDDGWHVNGAGLHFNPKFGFGVLDTSKMVELALTWKNVGERRVCEFKQEENVLVSRGHVKSIKLTVRECSPVVSIEHTVAVIGFQAPRRGDIKISIQSPFGTKSVLIGNRYKDESDQGFEEYSFLSLQNWGESPVGEWTVIFEHHESPPQSKKKTRPDDIASFTFQKFTFYGTDYSVYGGGSERSEISYTQSDRIYRDLAGQTEQWAVLEMYNREHN